MILLYTVLCNEDLYYTMILTSAYFIFWENFLIVFIDMKKKIELPSTVYQELSTIDQEPTTNGPTTNSTKKNLGKV